MIGKLVALLIGIGGFFLLFAKTVMGWTNLDPSTCTTFHTSNMVPEYENPGSAQYFAKILNDLGFNFRRNVHMVFANVSFTAGEEKDFDVNRDWDGMLTCNIVRMSTGSLALPYTETNSNYVRPAWLLLSTSYQELNSGAIFDIKALATGGIRIKNTHGSDSYYLTGSLWGTRNN